MNKVFIVILITAIGYGMLANPVRAQSSILQKTLDSIEDLINVKDENSESLAFRVQAFSKVIELSVSETKEFKIKLLALENLDATSTAWQKTNVAKLNETIEYYENQKKLLNKQTPITLEWIKTTAQEFKKWREENYLTVANPILDFLLLNQEKKAIETARARFQKINLDLENLKKKNVKGLNEAFDYLVNADQAINEGINLNEQAVNLFWATSTATSTEQISQPSIRDLVRNSLSKIKEAYQIFIEMSNLVRKLLI